MSVLRKPIGYTSATSGQGIKDHVWLEQIVMRYQTNYGLAASQDLNIQCTTAG